MAERKPPERGRAEQRPPGGPAEARQQADRPEGHARASRANPAGIRGVGTRAERYLVAARPPPGSARPWFRHRVCRPGSRGSLLRVPLAYPPAAWLRPDRQVAVAQPGRARVACALPLSFLLPF